jgi:cytoskeletal protein CcmA (bactofilin family)
MAISAFGRGRDGDSGGAAAGAEYGAKSAGSPGGLTAFIDQGAEFEGKLSFRDTVRIDGRFQGEISSENTLIVGESGEIQAAIHSNTVIVSGTVVGNIKAACKVVLHKTSNVEGDIETASLVVEDGATLRGQVKMASKNAASEKAPSLRAVGGDASPKGGNGDSPRGKEGESRS